jgi:transposase
MLYCGIDWGEQALEYHLRTPDSEVLTQGSVKPDAAGIAELFATLDGHARPDQIAVGIETAHGAWVQALLDRGYLVYALNPKTVDAFREALSAAGNKSDRIDAGVIARFLAACQKDLHPLRPDAPEIIALRIACQDRVRLVQERTAKLNELRSVLKIVYPAFIGFFADIESQIALEFLQQFPTQDQMRTLSGRRLQGWLSRHGYTATSRIPEMKIRLEQPVLPVPAHLQSAKVPLITYLARSLLALQAEIAECDGRIREMFEAMPEADWVSSLPGAGPVLSACLLACIGRDPQRFADVDDARALMGTAPVTKASGKSRVVLVRRGCWKFARRSLHLFADHSRRTCAWAQAFYERQISRGSRHHAAIRALAHKWLKIILAMKRTGARYEEARFTHSQRRYLLKAAELKIGTPA